MNIEQLYSWTLKFHKVTRQHIWGEVANFIAFFCSSFQNVGVKEYYKKAVLSQGNRTMPQLFLSV